jgi:hypothetical protein
VADVMEVLNIIHIPITPFISGKDFVGSNALALTQIKYPENLAGSGLCDSLAAQISCTCSIN